MTSAHHSELQAAVEQLSQILDRYLWTDLDAFSYEQIAETIRALEHFREKYGREDGLSVLIGLVLEIISYLYVARGYASTDVPRHLEYYRTMNRVRECTEQIKGLT